MHCICYYNKLLFLHVNAFILAKCVDDRGADVAALTSIHKMCVYFLSLSSKKGFKLVIVDEADAMTRDAQNALRREVHREHAFCLICNSRCTRFRPYVIQQESIDITPDGIKAIVTLSSGDMRRSRNVLQVRKNLLPVLNTMGSPQLMAHQQAIKYANSRTCLVRRSVRGFSAYRNSHLYFFTEQCRLKLESLISKYQSAVLVKS
uniref:Replication factor C (activator 1) 5 n=1 Tax=Oncorhynchus kisutch TaxID=8019 RepID=A0A8C7JSF2_ONCKI